VLGAVAARKFPVLAGVAVQDGTSIFVSRGVGTVYLPLRVNCPPEVALITLRRADPTGPITWRREGTVGGELKLDGLR
jgi:hypothetical protein